MRSDPLDPDRGQYVFAQSLLRTVAYEMVPRRERRPRHLAAANHLRASFPAEGEDIAEVIAAHHLDAYRAAEGDPDADELRAQALEALRRAGQRAQVVGAPEVAERSYRTAAELARDEAERAELDEQAGRMAYLSGHFSEALELLGAAERAHREAGRIREAARMALYTGQTLWGVGRLQEGIDRMQAALDALEPERHDADVAALSAEVGRALVFSGRAEEAAPLIESALTIGEAIGRPEIICEALTTKGLIYDFTNRPEEARILTEGAIRIAERHGLGEQLERPQLNIAEMYVLWDLPEAEEHLESALAVARRVGDPSIENAAGSGLILLNINMCRWDVAQRLAEELLDPTRPARQGSDQVHARIAILNALRGDFAAAHTSLQVLAPWEDAENAEYRGLFAATAGMIALTEGRLEPALERSGGIIRESVAMLGTGSEIVRQAWPDAIEAALGLGLVDEATDLLAVIGALPPGLVAPYLHAQGQRYRARLAALRGEHDAAEADFRGALDRFAALRYPYRRAEAELDFARWLAERGRADEATGLAREAVATFMGLGALPAVSAAREAVLLAGLEDALEPAHDELAAT